ncbi:NUDIX hydrolase [Maribellus maritimus]|uniref:NUDIX hydrolase n=1 Tax=Maribellus maritimus TaxID=2870838 RepID=UPI001EEC0A5A|nr:NUDIX domain-containing protein [Maribellus maritimus]MCG6186608.1 NUDIX domain-containing protein [Maribellus maritimus]
MYKVFFNQKLINISTRENITLNKTTIQGTDSFNVFDVRRWFQNFILNNVAEAVLTHSSPVDFFEVFKSAFIQIDAAGGVVFNGEGKQLFILRNGVWDLPKGKVEKGETTRDAAIREVEEECGITGLQIARELPSTYHIYQSPYKKSKGEWIFKETFWYEMNYSGAKTGVPQQEEGITKIKWFAPAELGEVLENTYENLRQIINLYRV